VKNRKGGLSQQENSKNTRRDVNVGRGVGTAQTRGTRGVLFDNMRGDLITSRKANKSSEYPSRIPPWEITHGHAHPHQDPTSIFLISGKNS
jgi:hypothetical protein